MHPAGAENAFTPELWMWDVGELFLAGKDGRYLELNLAPNGAWWMQGFESARVLDNSFDVEEFAVQVNGADLSISLYKLERYLGAKENWRVNVTAILQSPECEFLSLLQLPGDVADFHQPEVYGKYADIVIE